MVKLVVVLFVALLGGRAALTVTDTVPLAPAKPAPAGSAAISDGGYRWTDLAPQPADHPDLVVLVAMSGGGKRSASFGYGALQGMREVNVPFADDPQPLLRIVDAIAGVSGGSFPAAYYGLYRDQTFGNFETLTAVTDLIRELTDSITKLRSERAPAHPTGGCFLCQSVPRSYAAATRSTVASSK